MTASGARADLSDGCENDVLCGDAGRDCALIVDPHPLWFDLAQRLRRQHVADFGRANSECERAEAAVGAGMAVRTHDGQARQRQPQLRSDHVQNDLILASEIEQLDAYSEGAAPHLAQQPSAIRVAVGVPPRIGRDRMIGRREGQLGVAHGKTALGEAGKARPGLKVMEQMAVDGEQGHSATELSDHML